jgi:hypothetical protein
MVSLTWHPPQVLVLTADGLLRGYAVAAANGTALTPLWSVQVGWRSNDSNAYQESEAAAKAVSGLHAAPSHCGAHAGGGGCGRLSAVVPRARHHLQPTPCGASRFQPPSLVPASLPACPSPLPSFRPRSRTPRTAPCPRPAPSPLCLTRTCRAARWSCRRASDGPTGWPQGCRSGLFNSPLQCPPDAAYGTLGLTHRLAHCTWHRHRV